MNTDITRIDQNMKITVEDESYAGHTIADQMIRTLMFNKRSKILRTVDEVYRKVQDLYCPQCSPLGVYQYVLNSYNSWIKFMIERKEDSVSLVTAYPIKEKDFKRLCPDYDSVLKYHCTLT